MTVNHTWIGNNINPHPNEGQDSESILNQFMTSRENGGGVPNCHQHEADRVKVLQILVLLALKVATNPTLIIRKPSKKFLEAHEPARPTIAAL